MIHVAPADALRPPVLVGRDLILARLAGLLDDLRDDSAALLLEGPPGIGKTALLDAADDLAAERNLRVVRLRAAESDAAVPHLVLHGLRRILWPHLGEVAGHHAEVFRGVFDEGTTADPWAVGLSLLNLLGAAAEAEPLVVLVDDGHWIDPDGLLALGLAARRLSVERCAVIVAARPDELVDRAFAGVDRWEVPALSAEASTALIRGSVVEVLDPATERRLLDVAEGIPLALVELARAAETGSPRPPTGAVLPIAPALARSFAPQLEPLGDACCAALLIVALSIDRRRSTLQDALTLVGLSLDDLEPARIGGLLDVAGGELRFRHAVVASVVAQRANDEARRAAHLALASASPPGDDDRRALHLLEAQPGPSESVAALVAASAARQRVRGGLNGALELLVRAAEITPDPRAAADRLVSGAGWALDAGLVRVADDLVSRADRLAEAPPNDRRALLRARIAVGHGDPVGALRLLDRLLAAGPSVGVHVEALVEATRLALTVAPARAVELATEARRRDDRSEPARSHAVRLAHGLAHAFQGDLDVARRELLAHPSLLDGPAELDEAASLLVDVADGLRWIGESHLAADLLGALVADARSAGRTGVLAEASARLAQHDFFEQRFALAWARLEEAAALAEVAGQRRVRDDLAVLLSWLVGIQGDLDRAESICRDVARHARPGTPLADRARHGLGVLMLFRDDPAAAVAELEPLRHRPVGANGFVPMIGVWEQDLIEAHLRLGDRPAAEGLLAEFERRVDRYGSRTARSTLHRCRGMIATSESEARRCFGDALTLAEGSALTTARTELCWGRWCAEQDRRSEAREHLGRAESLASSIGAAALAWSATSLMAALDGVPTPPPPPAAVTAEARRVLAVLGAGVTADDAADAVLRSSTAVVRSVGRPAEPTAADASVRLIGRFAVERAGVDVTPPAGNPSSAVKIVALAGGEVHAEVLAEELWPEAPPGRGRARLRNVLGRVRQAAGELLVRDGPMIRLAAGSTVDLTAFQRTAGEVRAAGDAGRAVALLEDHGAELLPGDLHAPWSAGARERHRAQVVALHDLVADARLAAGAVEAAVRHWEAIAALDPLDESLLVRAAERLVEVGRPVEAARFARLARAALAQLGLPAGDRIAALERGAAG